MQAAHRPDDANKKYQYFDEVKKKFAQYWMSWFVKCRSKDRGRKITRHGIKGAHNNIIRDKLFCVNRSNNCGKINSLVTLVNEIIEYNIVNTGLDIHAKKCTLAKTGKNSDGQ